METTALQDVIAIMNQGCNPNEFSDKVILLLEKEKEQIIAAYYAGTAQFAHEAEIVRPLPPEDYYNQTYQHAK